MIGLDVAVAFGLYMLLRPVSRPLALVPPTSPSGRWRPAAPGRPSARFRRSRPARSVRRRPDRVRSLVPLLGRLLRTSRAVPRLLAIGTSATGLVYLVGSFAALAAPGTSSLIDPLQLIAIVVEPAFAIRLVVRGLRVAPRPAPSVSGAARPAGSAAISLGGGARRGAGRGPILAGSAEHDHPQETRCPQ